jgi:RNA polymerase sigma factor (TIGR02999 family)
VSDVTLLLQRIERGEPGAAEALLPLVYEELRRLAAQKMAREAAGHTLQPTALVHEAWLRLGGDQQPNWRSRAHFFGAAAEAMRRILVDHARRRHRQRHGGGQERIDINAIDVASPTDEETLLAVNEALDELAAHDAAAAQLVKLRYFVGLTAPEAAEALGQSLRSTERLWAYARAWLRRRLTGRPDR